MGHVQRPAMDSVGHVWGSDDRHVQAAAARRGFLAALMAAQTFAGHGGLEDM